MENFSIKMFINIIFQLNEFMYSIFPTLMNSFGVWIRSFVILYFVIVGILILKGEFGNATNEVATSLVIITILYSIIMESNVYFSMIVNPFINVVNELSGFFVDTINADSFVRKGNGVKGLLMQIDEMFGKIVFIIESMKPSGTIVTNGWVYFQALGAIIVLIFFLGATYAAFFALIVIGFFSLYLLFTVGGIFIFFASFKKTRFIFYSWLRAIANYALLIVFTCMVMSICIFGMNVSINALADVSGANAIFTTQFAASVCWSMLTLAMLLKAPDFAAALSGGQAGSTTGITAGLSMAGGAMAAGFSKTAWNQYTKAGMSTVGHGLTDAGNATYKGVYRAYSRMMGLKDSEL